LEERSKLKAKGGDKKIPSVARARGHEV